MGFVIVCDHSRYGRVQRSAHERRSEQMAGWTGEAFAARLDGRDSVWTLQSQAEDLELTRLPGGSANRITYRVVPPVPGAETYYSGPPSPPGLSVSEIQRWEASRRAGIQARVIEASLATYRIAARWARPRGVLGVLMGHGAPLIGYEGARSYIVADFAPAGMARLTTPKLEDLWERSRASRHLDLDELRPEQRLVHEMGAVFRSQRVRRVDLLSCAIGYLDLGQRFIDTLHAFWRIPVRALIGISSYNARGEWQVIGLADYHRMSAPPLAPGQRHVVPPLGGLLMQGPVDSMRTDPPGYFPDLLFRTSRMRRP
ncbi:MAG: hypothetical protein K8H88_09135 [Sandaracinaceae bacterium]|nr:hypothetical protein [Sandaracinaceae bacterium]